MKGLDPCCMADDLNMGVKEFNESSIYIQPLQFSCARQALEAKSILYEKMARGEITGSVRK